MVAKIRALPIRCRCGGDASETKVKWLAGDFAPSRAYYCFRCLVTWYAFKIIGEQPLIIAMDEKSAGVSWDDYLKQRMAKRRN